MKFNENFTTLGLGKSGMLKMMYAKRVSPSASSAAPTTTFYFNGYDAGGEEWNSNPEEMVDGSLLTEASSIFAGDVQLLTGNTCDGSDLGIINKVELRGHGKVSDSGIRIDIRPVFSGGDGDDHDAKFPDDTAKWNDYIDITSDTNAPVSWDWASVVALDCDIFHATGAGLPFECQKVEIRING